MMLTVLDIETTSNGPDRSPSFYWSKNSIVSVGWDTGGTNGYACIKHNTKSAHPKTREKLQYILDNTILLIGHNIKFDLGWLQECGFKYEGETYDTMIYEYYNAGGKNIKLDLSSCCRRHGLPVKLDEAGQLFADGYGYEEMPWKVVEEYGRNDVEITRKLYEAQMEGVNKEAVDLMNNFCYVLTQMERNGIQIDTDELLRLEKEFEEELAELSVTLEKLVREAVGDTPFSLNSNADLSWIVFSRKPYDKKFWKEYFNLGTEIVNGTHRQRIPKRIDPKLLEVAITKRSFLQYKTKARQCDNCGGLGKISIRKKNGDWGKPTRNCPTCGNCGIIYESTGEVAGFKQGVSSTYDLASHGYKTEKNILHRLATRTTDDKAKRFLKGMVRFNAITSYLNTYIAGIKRYVGRNDILHTQFMQCVTKTGRLSSRSPNLHNQPRGGTFPIRKVVVSRWKEGSITEGDYSQLEFRVAAELSKCLIARNDIIQGIDVHQYTADVLTKAGQPTSRQEAKEHTFKPLYGGTSGSQAERTYYKNFTDKYIGIKRWHKKILEIACTHKKLTLPTGRVYYFPWATRTGHGGVSGATKIKNYPVQGFATADIVPLGCTKLYHLMKEEGLKSLLINEVHDSVVVDTYPGEEEAVLNCIRTALLGVVDDLDEMFDYNFTVPLAIEIKRGINWLEMDVVLEASTE
jgi:DNA polymerase I-like protein with 3'-5' exonuclease and polymerase domains